MRNMISKAYNAKLLAYGAALLGILLYLIKSVRFITYQYSIIDEGLFLMKGIYFTNGQYQPYQEFGFWMNKLPFGYLFAGWVQNIFGHGIRTGRITALILSILMVIGIWLITKRITHNLWLAALSIWVYALNNSIIQIYSHFLSEVLVSFLIVWSLFFILGKHRHAVHYLSGGFLLGLIVITRQNMLPLLILLPLYVRWETKKTTPALQVFFPAASIFIFIHLLYWPNILQMWLPWFPESLTPFLNSIRFEVQGQAFYDPIPPFQTRLHAFWEGVRIHFVPFTTSIISIFLIIFSRKNWSQLKSHQNFKLILFFPITYMFLLIEHFYATIMLDYCVYCFSIYLSFFTAFGVLSLTVLPDLLSIEIKNSIWNKILGILFSLIWITGIFYGGWQKLEGLLKIQVPRSIKNPFQTVDIWGVFHNKFGWSFDSLRVIIPTFFGVFMGFLFVSAVVLLVFLLRKRFFSVKLPSFILISLLTLGILFLPSPVLGGEIELTRCNNVIESFEAAGSKLATLIPPNATVYYAGDFSPIVMLYLPTMNIFPQQYEQDYSHRIGGDSVTLEKHGYWNDESAEKWIQQSDFLVISEKNFQRLNMKEKIPYNDFHLVYQSEPILSCSSETAMMVFERNK